MKSIANITIKVGVILLAILFYSCQKDFLDRSPISTITPENYLRDESQLDAYAINRYPTDLTTFGSFNLDNNTDVEASRGYSSIYVPGQYKVGQSGGDWSFADIYSCNYFLGTVLPRWKAGQITGNKVNIDHFVGEMYFFRALAYFKKLQAVGDFPIIRTILSDNKEILVAASKRAPMNEVARFIVSDLDSAALLMKTVSPDGVKNRLSKVCAQLLKSRVSLYTATRLKYFKGTAFVPNGTDWPGKGKDYNSSYNFPSGSIDNEISFFFTQSLDASKLVADANALVINSMATYTFTTKRNFAIACDANPYCRMFGQENMSGFSEVLLWRKYSQAQGVTNVFGYSIQQGTEAWTRGFADNYLMANGLPIYASESGYAGDDSTAMMNRNRDARCRLFLTQPGQMSILYPNIAGDHSTPIVLTPDFMNLLGNHDQPTGYVGSKGNNFDEIQASQYQGSYVGSIVFRAVEAYLNYIEACYEKNGTLDATAKDYWQKIRARAGIDVDYQKTVNATVMSEEAKNNWSAYSGGQLIDKTLYNIRRERSCELVGEGLRLMDLMRWRAMDQMINTPYHIEGFKIWGPMKDWYKATDLKYSIGDKSTVSDPALSPYLRLYQKTSTSLVYNGYKWKMAHYLSPIAVQHFLITSKDGIDVTTSPIYQNPGWPVKADMGATN